MMAEVLVFSKMKTLLRMLTYATKKMHISFLNINVGYKLKRESQTQE